VYHQSIQRQTRIIAGDITNWNTAFGWGDHSVAGYLDTDQTIPQTVSNGKPIFSAGLTATDILLDTTYVITGNEPQGSMYFNVDEETFDFVMNGAVLQVGQETVYHVRNNTISDIADGVAVMATGTIGNSSRITVAPMNNDGTINPDYFLGIATEPIAAGTDGKVTHFGKVRGIDTTGTPYSEVWADGDLIYLDPTTAGALTKVQPPAVGGSAYKAPVAIVIHAHPNGTLFIRVTGNQGIHEAHDVEVTAIANQDVLRWNTANLRWENYSSTNWDTAYSWGNHASQGYITSFTETDPVFIASDVFGVTTADINSWDAAYQWGDHDGLYLPIGGGTMTGNINMNGFEIQQASRVDIRNTVYAGTDTMTFDWDSINDFSLRLFGGQGITYSISADKWFYKGSELMNLGSTQTVLGAITFSLDVLKQY
jgi:hypothetical protein